MFRFVSKCGAIGRRTARGRLGRLHTLNAARLSVAGKPFRASQQLTPNLVPGEVDISLYISARSWRAQAHPHTPQYGYLLQIYLGSAKRGLTPAEESTPELEELEKETNEEEKEEEEGGEFWLPRGHSLSVSNLV